jgi:predicted dehydrogenase
MKQPISRRHLLQGSAAAAAAVGLSRFTALSYGNIVGSNDAIRIGVIGFNGRGRSHIDAWSNIKGVRLTALCDADEAVLNKTYANVMKGDFIHKSKSSPTTRPTTRPSTQPTAAGKEHSKEHSKVAKAPAAPTKVYPVEKYGDLRHLIDDKDIDAISTATPNHWHSLVTILGCQAGKDVYVEKPVSHDVWEGRQSVEAARKYNRIVQAGTQSRSVHALKVAFKWIQEGNLGKILVARGLCYKRRGTIGKVDATPEPPKTVNLDLWCGPSPLEAPHRQHFHYDWHWFWQTGNGDIGNQGIHQMDIARWALGKNELSPSIISVGGRFGYDDDGQTPNTQFAVHNYGDSLLIFEVRGLPSKTGVAKMDVYKGQGVGHVIECEHGYLSGTTAYDNDGKEIKEFDPKKSKIALEDRFQGDHFANFIDAVRSRKVADLHADILEGHLSSALCHTSNISYQLGKKAKQEDIKDAIKADSAATETFERFKEHLAVNEVDIAMDQATLGVPLKMDPKTEKFIGNEQANTMLRRVCRSPFVVPENV